MNSISKNIKDLRIAKGWTQQDMADSLSVSRQLVSNWESGRSMPNIDTLNEIASKLNTDINILLYGEKADNTQLKKQLKASIAVYIVVLLLKLALELYTNYRLANGVNIHMPETWDKWYLMPNRSYTYFIRPFEYICPPAIFYQLLKYKGYIKNISNAKIFKAVKILRMFILSAYALSGIIVVGFTAVEGVGTLYDYLPVFLQRTMSNLFFDLLLHPWIFCLTGVIYEIARPFERKMTELPAYSPGRLNTIARNIKKLRLENNLTQQQMAEKLFVTRQTVSNWENGKIMPDLVSMLQICENTDISLNDLLYEKEKGNLNEKITLAFGSIVIVLFLIYRVYENHMYSLIRNGDQLYGTVFRNYNRVLLSLEKIVFNPILYFAIPVVIIRVLKLIGVVHPIKSFKYKKLLNLAIIVIFFLTFYSYIPTMLQVDIKEAVRMARPTLWISYPDFSWLPSLPQNIHLIIYNMYTKYRLSYSILGVAYEILKPEKNTNKKISNT